MDLVAESQLLSGVDELAVGDSIYLEKTGRTYWVEEISRNRVVLSDVEGRTNTWIPDTLEAAFEADAWIRQSGPPAQLTDFEEP